VLASGASIRLAESLALIWKSTRISNSVSVFRPQKTIHVVVGVAGGDDMKSLAGTFVDETHEHGGGVGGASGIAAGKAEFILLPELSCNFAGRESKQMFPAPPPGRHWCGFFKSPARPVMIFRKVAVVWPEQIFVRNRWMTRCRNSRWGNPGANCRAG